MIVLAMPGFTNIRIPNLNYSIKIVAVSGFAANEKVTQAVSGSIKAFITKPYTVMKLLSNIN